jgi:hypothetical protein
VTAARVLDVARRELGVAESPAGSNRQPYGKAYGWDGVAWCAQWAWWVLTEAGCAALVPKTASTVVMRDWYRQRGQWHTSNPKPGDLVFFRFPGNNNPVNHVGLVEVVEPGGTLITIEGNTAGTNAGDQRNGGMVARKRRLSNIVGFARPAYTPPEEDDELSQQQVDQINRNIGFARDQILTRLGVTNPPNAPAKLSPEQLAGIDPARRVDVGYARDQLVAELASQRALLEAIAEKVGITGPPGLNPNPEGDARDRAADARLP